MLWIATIPLQFLFLYSTTGIPLNDYPQKKLSLTVIRTQWEKDSDTQYWPKGEVSYVFDDKSYDEGIKIYVQNAMAMLERDSCIRFKEQQGQSVGSWLHFTNPDAQRACVHEPVYQAEGEIQVILGYDCLRQRDILHAVLHGVGFKDEISHPQRDLYVKVMWANIQSAYKPMFRIQPMDTSRGVVEYDPMSIMQFHDRAYSLNGQATISPLLPGLRIAPSSKLSHLDKLKLRTMFGHECNKREVGKVLDKCQGILTQLEESVSTTNPEDDKSYKTAKDDQGAPDDDVTPVDEGVTEDPNDSKVDIDPVENTDGNNENEDIDKKDPGEVIVVGNDIKENGPKGRDEIAGSNASDNNNDDGPNDSVIETINVGPDEDLTINPTAKGEVIVVGNDKTNGGAAVEDLRGKFKLTDD